MEFPAHISLTAPIPASEEEGSPTQEFIRFAMEDVTSARLGLLKCLAGEAPEEVRELVDGFFSPYGDAAEEHDDQLRFALWFMLSSIFVRREGVEAPDFDSVEGVNNASLRLAWKDFVSDFEAFFPELA